MHSFNSTCQVMDDWAVASICLYLSYKVDTDHEILEPCKVIDKL